MSSTIERALALWWQAAVRRWAVVCWSTDLLRLCLSVAEFVNKVFTVPPEDAVRQLLADQRTGLPHNIANRTGIILPVHAVVDFPLISSHHVPKPLLPHHGLLCED